MGQAEQVCFRTATQRDGIAMWRSRRHDGTMSPYSYFALLNHFGDSSVVAELDGELVGFLIARRAKAGSVEIVDGAVDFGLAQPRSMLFQLLARLLELPACRGAAYVDAAPSCDRELVQALMPVRALPLVKCAS